MTNVEVLLPHQEYDKSEKYCNAIVNVLSSVVLGLVDGISLTALDVKLDSNFAAVASDDDIQGYYHVLVTTKHREDPVQRSVLCHLSNHWRNSI
jgi:hypothetical protein